MTRTEHLLSILAEECAEVAQRATKALRFGLTEVQPGQDYTNAERIMGELSDLVAAVEMLQRDGALPEWLGLEYRLSKVERVERFLAYSDSLGLVSADSSGDGHGD